jgi:hypothetical protein
LTVESILLVVYSKVFDPLKFSVGGQILPKQESDACDVLR